MKFMHLVTLLLALWAPFNAVTAGVSMLDCPMDDLSLGQAAPCPAHAGPADSTVDNGMAGCDHCSNCVLMHGGASVPTTFTSTIVPLPQVVPRYPCGRSSHLRHPGHLLPPSSLGLIGRVLSGQSF